MCSVIKLIKQFPTEQSCLDFLESKRFANGYYCVYCVSTKISKHNEKDRRNRLQCGDCKKSFSVTVGTIFHRTHFDLRNWFYIISMMLNAKKGISAYQVARELELNRPTVWAIMHRVRKVLETEQGELLRGIFEMDETYVNAKKDEDDNDKGTQGRSTKTKTPVIGIIQRGGQIRMQSTLDNKIENIKPIIAQNISKDATIYTDEARIYQGLSKEYKHKTVNHGIGEYVNQDSHTNTIEGAFSHFKRMIIGIYHHISEKHIDKYADMFCFRFNTRELSEVERMTNLLEMTSEKLSYKALIS